MYDFMRVGLLIGLTGLFGCGGGAADETGGNSSSKDTGSAPESAGTIPGATPDADPDAGGEATKDSLEAEGDWCDGDTIPSGMAGVPDIQVLKVHKNGHGSVCGSGKSATLAYKAMLADGTVIDPGQRPFTFKVGAGRAIKGWDVIVAKMRVGDSFTVTLPQQLAYGPSKGDLKFDMELLSFQ